MKTKYILILSVAIALLSGCAAQKQAVSQKKTPVVRERSAEITHNDTIATENQPVVEIVHIDTISESAIRATLAGEGKRPSAIDRYVAELKKKDNTVVIEDYVPQPFVPALAIQAQPNFSSLYAPKAKANIDFGGIKMSTNGSVTMLVDSIIIISVQPILGIELMRLEVTKSDVMLLDKMNRRYVKMDYAELQAELGLPVTYNDIQAIAMDRIFVVGHDQSFINDQTDTTSVNGRTMLTIADGKLDYTYAIDNGTFALLSTSIKMLGKKETTQVTYSGHTTYVSGIVFPSVIDMSYTGGKQEGKLGISLPSITFNGKVNAARVNLNAYNKTTLNTILSGK